MKIYLIIVPFLFVTVISCDPMRRLQMKNESAGEVEFKWKLKENDSLYLSPFFISNSQKTDFLLKNKKPHNFINMSFGIGAWSEEYLNEMSKKLESLEINSIQDSLKFNSPAEIYNFLLKHRKGIGNRKIMITVSR